MSSLHFSGNAEGLIGCHDCSDHGMHVMYYLLVWVCDTLLQLQSDNGQCKLLHCTLCTHAWELYGSNFGNTYCIIRT